MISVVMDPAAALANYHPWWYDPVAWVLSIYAIVLNVAFLWWYRPAERMPFLAPVLIAPRAVATAVVVYSLRLMSRLLPGVPEAKFLGLLDLVGGLLAQALFCVGVTAFLVLQRQERLAFASGRHPPPGRWGVQVPLPEEADDESMSRPG